MVTFDNIIIILGVLQTILIVFVVIIHYIRRREMSPEFNWKMDFGGVDIIDTLVWFFKKMRKRRRNKKEDEK